ncbi:hypothetical protein J6590_051940 [Homalodisca vitripennis]|nr:hypothetical protein J6590_051940 [Homalodisca vitripennis]
MKQAPCVGYLLFWRVHGRRERHQRPGTDSLPSLADTDTDSAETGFAAAAVPCDAAGSHRGQTSAPALHRRQQVAAHLLPSPTLTLSVHLHRLYRVYCY